MLPHLGLPEINKEGYEYASNLWLAGNLKGKLLLVVGTSDVLISETMKVVDALIRAGKPYDLLVLPEQYHSFLSFPGTARTYFWDAMRRYFQEHLKPYVRSRARGQTSARVVSFVVSFVRLPA